MKNTNEITITLEHASLTHLRLLSQIAEEQSGFPINAEIWAYVLGNLGALEDQARKDRWEEGLTWLNEYLEDGWDMAYDTAGYLGIARLLDDAAEDAAADDNNLYAAGAFDALAKAGAGFLADEYGVSPEAARYAIYKHYGVAW